jgi:Amidohydrolase family
VLNSSEAKIPCKLNDSHWDWQIVDRTEMQQELRRLIAEWNRSGPNLQRLFKQDPDLQEKCTRGTTLLIPTRDGVAQLAWTPHRANHKNFSQKDAALEHFIEFLVNPLALKLGGPCERCARFYIKSTKRQKTYCSRRCGMGRTALSATQKRREAGYAHAASAAKAASLAGCTSVEHGAFITDDVFELMVKNGTYFDPNIGLVLQNYIANKEKFLGIGNYNEEGFADMVKGESIVLEGFKRALKIQGLQIIYGTDAVAGAHGRNGEEFIARVQQGGQDPMAAMISATSLSAKSLGLGDQIGTIAPGMQADIIAMDGNPLTDATSVRRVEFVMKGGTIFKNVVSSQYDKK